MLPPLAVAIMADTEQSAQRYSTPKSLGPKAYSVSAVGGAITVVFPVKSSGLAIPCAERGDGHNDDKHNKASHTQVWNNIAAVVQSLKRDMRGANEEGDMGTPETFLGTGRIGPKPAPTAGGRQNTTIAFI